MSVTPIADSVMKKFVYPSKLFICSVILLIAVILFIFSNSLPNQETSKTISQSFGKWMTPVLAIFFDKAVITDHFIRKAAHFIEYCIFGIVLSFLFCVKRQLNFRNILFMFLLPIWIAVIDETIQLYTKRGSQIQDVWLDYAGAFSGCCIFLLIYGVILVIKR